jgi:hypothetical protein
MSDIKEILNDEKKLQAIAAEAFKEVDKDGSG